MKKQVKLHSNLTEAAAKQGLRASGTPLEFSSPEQMLRHDALHTPVPPRIEERLRESLADSEVPERPWWRKLLGG